MPSFIIQALVDRAATYADMDGNFVEPHEWLSWYNTEARALDLFMLRHGYTQVKPTVVDNDPTTYDIVPGPACTAVLGVYEVRDGKFRPLHYQNPAEFYPVTEGGEATHYTVERENVGTVNVVLKPKPSTGLYRGLFYQDVGTATELTDTVSWPFGVEEFIVLGMAVKALTKENSDTSQVERLKDKETQRIEELVWSHNYADSARIRNVDRRDRGWSNGINYGTWESWTWL